MSRRIYKSDIKLILIALLVMLVLMINYPIIILYILLIVCITLFFIKPFNYFKNRSTVSKCSTINDLLEEYKNKPTNFEHYIASLFELLGYDTEVTPPTNDGGKDIKMYKDELKIVVEVKLYEPKNKITSEKIQKLHSAKYDTKSNKAIFVTTSDFTKNAVEFANRNSIELINGDQLASIIQKLNRSTLEVNKFETLKKFALEGRSYLVLSLSLIVIIGILTSGFVDDFSIENISEKSNVAEDNLAREPEIIITSSDLSKVFDENIQNGNKNYKNKTVQVTGLIKTYENFVATSYVILKGYGEWSNYDIQCFFKNSELVEALSEYKMGDDLTIKGTCEGLTLTVIKIDDCTIVR